MADRHLRAVGSDEKHATKDLSAAARQARETRLQPLTPPKRGKGPFDVEPIEGQSVTRRVIFQARCRRLGCNFNGEERDYKGDASYDLARHNIDRHGGNEREGARE